MIRFRPAPPLDRYIECFWWSHRDEPQEHSEHMLPSGAAQMVFALHDSPILCRASSHGDVMAWSHAIVHGPQSSYYVAGCKPKGSTLGVSFRPGAAGAVLGVGMEDLADRHVPLDAIWGSRGVDLHHALMSACEPRELIELLERSLSARIHRPLLIHPAVAPAIASCSTGLPVPARVADAQCASGYSPRHFIALFRSAVGLSPKQYYRIRRFNYAVRAVMARDGQGFGDIAAAAGYSDQAHFVREFREFTGVTPTRYRPSGVDRPLHHRTEGHPASR
jgi:AraC-like DNA-binding protein